MAAHNELGKKGEALALELLLKKGYDILETNWRHQKAEVDIIAQKGRVLAVVEVKTRASGLFGDPQEFVDAKKKQLLIRAVDAYVNEKELDVEVRFDVIGILLNEAASRMVHLEDAFFHF